LAARIRCRAFSRLCAHGRRSGWKRTRGAEPNSSIASNPETDFLTQRIGSQRVAPENCRKKIWRALMLRRGWPLPRWSFPLTAAGLNLIHAHAERLVAGVPRAGGKRFDESGAGLGGVEDGIDPEAGGGVADVGLALVIGGDFFPQLGQLGS